MFQEAIDALGFNHDEKYGMYRGTAAILHMGELKFKQRPREEQADIDGRAEAEIMCELLGINCDNFLSSIMTPKVKVGTEWVTKSQTVDQVNFAVNALAKCIYARFVHSPFKT